jgi:hypothetical protein
VPRDPPQGSIDIAEVFEVGLEGHGEEIENVTVAS